MTSFLRGFRGSLVVSLVAAASVSAGFLVACVPAEPSKPVDGAGGAGGSTSGGAGGIQGGAGGATPGATGGATGGGVGGSAGGHTGSGGATTTGGSGGVTTTGAGGQAGVALGSEPCTSADPGNEDRDHATPYPLGGEFHGCLQLSADVDFYEFTTPAAPAAGGAITISITDVGPDGTVDSTAFAASDNSQIQSNGNASNGGSAYYWFNAAPAAKYRISVQRFYAGTTATPYTFKATYTPVNDSFEPNDLRTQPSPLTVGTPVQAFMFAGYTSSTGFASNAWEDWYRVTLAAGMVNITLAILATDADGNIVLYDALGTQVTSQGLPANGSTVVLNRGGITAGDYYVKITPFYIPTAKGSGTVLPQYVTQPYTLTVTQ